MTASSQLQRAGSVGFLLIMVALVGCCRSPDLPSRPVVVVSVLPQAFFVEKIAGDRVEIVVMIPPGANPSTYQPSIDQLKSFSRAKLYVKVGHPGFAFELAWVGRLLAENPDLEVVDGAAGLALPCSDPHLWLSPRLVRTMARNMTNALGEVLPDAKSALESNLTELLEEIEQVDSEVRARLQEKSGEKIFIFHAAWGYFAHEYGLVQVSLEEGAKEPGVRALADFIDQARSESARVIFVQPQFSQRSARVVAEEVGARVMVLDPLAPDWSANMRLAADAFQEALTE
jgi:zinc transport system substrate-binding protein